MHPGKVTRISQETHTHTSHEHTHLNNYFCLFELRKTKEMDSTENAQN